MSKRERERDGLTAFHNCLHTIHTKTISKHHSFVFAQKAILIHILATLHTESHQALFVYMENNGLQMPNQLVSLTQHLLKLNGQTWIGKQRSNHAAIVQNKEEEEEVGDLIFCMIYRQLCLIT